MVAMARTVRLECRVTPELADAIGAARDMASISMWLERSALEKLARDGVEVRLQGDPPPLRIPAAQRLATDDHATRAAIHGKELLILAREPVSRFHDLTGKIQLLGLQLH